MAFSRGAFTVVYPLARGTSPLATVLVAGIVFDELFSITQWIGVFTLITGIFGLAAYNLLHAPYERKGLGVAIILAAMTGVAIAGYTTIDALGVRATANPFSFLAWLFFLDGFFMPALAVAKRGGLPNAAFCRRLLPYGFVGGLVAVLSFGSIMLATRLDSVGQAAVLRETSTVFAAIIGWIVLKERVGPRRLVLIVLIALGAVIVEFGS